MGERQPMWNSHKAWVLVMGGMFVIGIANIWAGMCSLPEGFDENWRWADAGADAKLARRGAPVLKVDSGAATAPSTAPTVDAAPAEMPSAPGSTTTTSPTPQ